jgi:hypothetical protein
LVINLKTAKALGLIVSNQMQLLADEVIKDGGPSSEPPRDLAIR